MRFSISADKVTGVADSLAPKLQRRGHDVIRHGALADDERADVLELGLRATSAAELGEILEAWLAAEPSVEGDDRSNVAHLTDMERGDG